MTVQQHRLSVKQYRFLFILLLLGAFWLRVDQLDRYPTGLSADEAINTVDALYTTQSGSMPLYEDFGRPEPLYRLPISLGVLAYGASVWGLRLTSAFIGLLTVALAGMTTSALLHDQPPTLRRIGALAAAATLAAAAGHVTLSRAVYRGIIQPPLMLLFMAYLVRGLRSGSRRDLLLAGVWGALSVYTYTAALIVSPLLPGAIGVGLLVGQRHDWRRWLPRLLLVGIVVGALLLPVVGLILGHQYALLGRAEDVQAQRSPLSPAMLTGMLSQFFISADENVQYNVGGAPLLPPGFNVLFATGLVMLVLRWRRPGSWLLAGGLALAALPVMLAEELTHGLRVVGEYAFFPSVAGIGMVGAALLVRRLAGPERRRAAHAVLLAGLVGLAVGSGLSTARIYAAQWNPANQQPLRMYDTHLPVAEWFFRPDYRDAAAWMTAQDTPLLMPVSRLARADMRAWLLVAYPGVEAVDALPDLPPDTQVFIPWRLRMGGLDVTTRQYALLHGDMITLLPPFTAEAHAALLEGLADGQTLTRQGTIDTIGVTYSLPADTPLALEPRHDAPQIVTFGNDLTLQGWRGVDTLTAAGGPLTVTLDWTTPQTRIGHDYHAFAQLWTADGQALAGADTYVWRWLMPTTLWTPEDAVSVPFTLDVPPDLPPGAYRLVTGIYVFVDRRFPAVTADGAPAGDAITAGWLKVPQADPPPEVPATLDVTLGDALALRHATAAPGDSDGAIVLTLDWQALADRPAVDGTVFIHVMGPDGDLLTQDDRRPHEGAYPTFIWDAGERVRTVHPLDVGAVDPADVVIYAGMYTGPDFTRLPAMQDGEPVPDARVRLGTLAELMGNSE